MAKYTENFIEKGYATPRQILSLTLEDLEELGIAPIGHRKKIFKAIQNTKQQVRVVQTPKWQQNLCFMKMNFF